MWLSSRQLLKSTYNLFLSMRTFLRAGETSQTNCLLPCAVLVVLFLEALEVFNRYGLQLVRYMHIIPPDTNVREDAKR